MLRAASRIRTRDDAVERARAVTAYNEAAHDEALRIDTEDDWSKTDTVVGYGQYLNKTYSEIISSHQGSEDSKAQLAIRLEAIRSQAASQAGEKSAIAGRKLVVSQLGRDIQGLTARAMQEPGEFADIFRSYDAIIDDMAPALTPEDEDAFRTTGRQEIITSTLNGLMVRGDIEGVKSILSEQPGLLEILTPAQQRQIDSTVEEYEQNRDKWALEAQRKVAAAELIKGSPLTLDERLRIAGIEPKKGPETPLDEIRGIEAALGRPLTQSERERVLGVGGGGGMQSPTGKLIADRETVVRQYGEDSLQVAAIDEALAGGDEPPSLSDEAGIRKEYTRASQPFVEVRDAFSRIAVITKDVQQMTPQDDIGLVYSIMKMYDPGSRVTEGELAITGQTTGVPGRVVNLYNQVVSGNNLNAQQRQGFKDQAGLLMTAQLNMQRRLEAEYQRIAERSNVESDKVIVDFLGPYRDGLSSDGDGSADGGGNTDAAGNPVFNLDLQGNVINPPPEAEKKADDGG
jgi:hypothetical protein